MINLLESACLFFSVVAKAKESANEIDQKYIRNVTRSKVEAMLKMHAGNSTIEQYLSFLSENALSGLRLKNLHQNYLAKKREESWLPACKDLFSNPNPNSTAMWDLADHKHISDEKRGELVLSYMSKKENWENESCEFLWEEFHKDCLFDKKQEHVSEVPSLEML